MIDQLRHFEKESFEIQSKVKRSKDTETELHTSHVSITDLRSREKEYVKQIESLNFANKLKQDDVRSEQAKYEELRSYSNDLEGEIK